MNETDKAYIAGLFDGEGCISIRENKGKKGYVNPVIVMDCIISMTDFETVEWVHKVSGLGSLYIRDRTKENYKDQLRWAASSNQAAEFLKLILPYLHNKKEQAEIAIEFQSIETIRGGKGGMVDNNIILARQECVERLRRAKNPH